MEKRTSIFRQESLERMESPEQLDKYIQVSKPSAWILIAALSILGIAVFVWSVTGVLPQTVLTKGFVTEDGFVYCYVAPSEVQGSWIGKEVQLVLPDGSTLKGVVKEMESVPYSKSEISEIIQKDWIIDSIIDTSYMYQFKVETQSTIQSDILVEAFVTTNEVKPIQYILN